MEIKLNEQDVENFVKETLLKSGIGKSVESAIQKVLAPGYDNPIEKELKEYIRTVMRDLIHEKFAPQIKEAISAFIEKAVTQDLINKMTEAATNKMIEAARDY